MIKIERNAIESIERFRKAHNASVLTIMFTDMQGFTEYNSLHGEQKSKELREIHNKLLYNIIEDGGKGLIVKQIGDSVLAVFIEPSTAVYKALEIQSKFKLAEFKLRVRIGLHLGQVSVEDAIVPDVFGNHVNLASRIEHLANGDQILLSKAVYDSARTWLLDPAKPNIFIKKHGAVKLKGFSETEIIYEVSNDPAQKLNTPLLIKKRKIKRNVLVGGSGIILLTSIVFLIKANYIFNSYANLPIPYKKSKEFPEHPSIIRNMEIHNEGGFGCTGGGCSTETPGANGTEKTAVLRYFKPNDYNLNSGLFVNGPYNFSNHSSLAFFCKGSSCDTLKVIIKTWSSKLDPHEEENTKYFDFKNTALLTNNWISFTLPFNNFINEADSSVMSDDDLNNVLEIWFETKLKNDSAVMYIDEITIN